METITLSVPTVHCNACKLNIEESLDELGGVESSNVDLDAKSVTITFDPAAVDTTAISAAVEEAGYPVSG
jgi:copper ion binding protein